MYIDNFYNYVLEEKDEKYIVTITITLFIITIQSGTDNVFSRSIIRCIIEQSTLQEFAFDDNSEDSPSIDDVISLIRSRTGRLLSSSSPLMSSECR